VIEQLADGPPGFRREGNVLEVDFALPTRSDAARTAAAMIGAWGSG
jgi:hypothetical protein